MRETREFTMFNGINRTLFLASCLMALLIVAPMANAVPAPPPAVADMVGLYNWGVDYSSYDSSTDRLNWAAAKAAQTGTRTLRVAITAKDPYLVNPSQSNDDDPNWLVNVAASPAYAALFGSANFQTFMLTTYTPADGQGHLPAWINGFDPSSPAYEIESTQIQNLCTYLSDTYPSKTFIILNWEGDNAMQGVLGVNENPALWDNYVNWLQSRGDGVAGAKAAGAANVYFGIEFNRVVAPDGEPCGGAPFGGPGNQPTLSNRCVIDYVAPRIRNVDYFSYSSWQTDAVKFSQPEASLQQAINSALDGSLKLVRTGQIALQGQSTVLPASFMLGEFGFGRTDYGEYNAARYIEELVNALRGPGAFGASYAIFWQVLDNAPPPLNSWGLFRGSNGQITTLGTTFTALMNGQTPVIPVDGPEINQGGILNADPGPDQGTPNIHPQSTISIFGSNFSPSGNVVSVIQDNQLYLIQAGSANWFESPTQINATFPDISGQALVSVTNGGMIDSKAQLVNVTGDIQPDFTLSFDPSTVTVAAGKKITLTINIDRMGGFAGKVTITPPAASTGILAKSLRPVTTAGSSVTLKLKVARSASPGPYQLAFTGVDSTGRMRTATLTLVVQ